jgi:signal transduction histidine kinase/FixJ family two-component response regulator
MEQPNHHQIKNGASDSQKQIRVLHVDDDPAFTQLTQRWCERVHDDMLVITETDPTRALGQLEHGATVDVVISDYRMPEMNGLELHEQLQAQERGLPFVLVTGEGSESVAGEAMHAGVTDYFTKDEVADGFSLLIERVRSLALQRRATQESRRFGTLLEILNVPVAVLDNKGRMRATNPLFDDLVDATGNDPDARPHLQEFVSDTDRPSVKGYLERLRDDSGPDLLSVQLTVRTEFDSVPYRAQMAAVPGIDTTRNGVLVVLEPAKSDAKQFRATLSDLVEWTAGPYLTVDDDWEVTVVNQTAQELFGEQERSIIGHSLWEFFPAFEDATFHDQLRAVKQDGVPLDTEVYYAPSRNHFHVRAYRMSSGVAVYLQDVTDRTEREAELERLAERFQEFAKIVAHDLRNPISTAKGYANIVAEAGCDDEEAIAVVQQSIERAESIITQTLQFAEEGQVGTMTTIDLEAAVEDAWREVEAAREGVERPDATVQVESTVILRADPDAFTRVLGNLLRNAVEHGSANGSPAAGGGGGDTESTPTEEGVTVRVGTIQSSDTTLGFYVEDDGPGIPPEAHEMVFETRYSTSETGTGFGLAIVEQIAVAHGWSVSVTEGADGGARFEFTGIDPADGTGSTTWSASAQTHEETNDDDD